jgi:hypothetical protein
MKNFYRFIPVLLFALLLVQSCKKEEDASSVTPPPAANNNSTCNYTTNILVVDGASKNITGSSCHSNASDYTSEHYTDTVQSEGLTMIFNGTSAPAAGTYTAIGTVPVSAGQVFIEYFASIIAFQTTGGTVTVSDNGSSKVYSFCNLSFSDGASTKVISARATCN